MRTSTQSSSLKFQSSIHEFFEHVSNDQIVKKSNPQQTQKAVWSLKQYKSRFLNFLKKLFFPLNIFLIAILKKIL